MVHIGEIKAVEKLNNKLDKIVCINDIGAFLALSEEEFYLIRKSIFKYLSDITDDYNNDEYQKIKEEL